MTGVWHRLRTAIPAIALLLIFISPCGTPMVMADPSNRAYSGHGKNSGGPPPWAPAHGYRAKHRYRYYPDEKVYYDDGRGVYFYYRNGNWEVSAKLPGGIDIRLGDYVNLEMDTDKPFIYHNEIQGTYPQGKAKKEKGKGKSKWK